jgi:hypothetical protein
VKLVMRNPGKVIYETEKARPKNVKKCMNILKEFHYYFSSFSPLT